MGTAAAEVVGEVAEEVVGEAAEVVEEAAVETAAAGVWGRKVHKTKRILCRGVCCTHAPSKRHLKCRPAEGRLGGYQLYCKGMFAGPSHTTHMGCCSSLRDSNILQGCSSV